MIISKAASAAIVAAAFALVLFFMHRISPFSRVNLAVAILAAMFMGIYLFLVVKVKQRLERERRYRFHPNERVLRAEPLHKMALVPCFILLAIGVGLLLATELLWLVKPSVQLNVPSFELPSVDGGEPRVVEAKQLGIPIWWIPLLFSLPFLYAALAMWQNWKWYTRAITNQRHIEERQQSPYCFWFGRRFDDTQLHQIVDVNDHAGMLGSLFGWGTVIFVKRWRDGEDFRTQEVVLKFVPNAHEYAEELRRQSPELFPGPRAEAMNADVPLEIEGDEGVIAERHASVDDTEVMDQPR